LPFNGLSPVVSPIGTRAARISDAAPEISDHAGTSLGPACTIATRPNANFFQKDKAI